MILGLGVIFGARIYTRSQALLFSGQSLALADVETCAILIGCILIGVASTAGQWIVVLAFRYADASVLAPFSYTQLLWVSVLGFLVFGEVPDAYTITGAAFIVASGLYTAHRERVRRSQLLAVSGEPSPNA